MIRSSDSFSVSRSGKSSGELGSVMILIPMVGNRFDKRVDQKNITIMNKLYVGNLSYNTTENDLQDTFAPHGTVLEANLITDRVSGRARGFGFVTMSTPAEAQNAATALNGVSLDGRALTVNVARPREERTGGGSSFGGNRSNDGGNRREFSGSRY